MDVLSIFHLSDYVEKLNTIYKKQSFHSPKVLDKKIISTPKRILNSQKAEIYEVEVSDPTIVIKYKIFVDENQKSIKFVLYNLRKLALELEEKATLASQSENRQDAQRYLMRLKNIDVNSSTHRLEISTRQGYYNLCWLIDLDLHNADSYGSTGGKKILKSMINSIIEQDLSANTTSINLEQIVYRDWPQILKNYSFTTNDSVLEYLTDDKIKVIYHPNEMDRS